MVSRSGVTSHKFGLAPFAPELNDHPLDGSFQVQFLTAFVLREYAADLAEHLARFKNPQALRLDPDIRRFLGLGNATGMGLVPFVINNPGVTHTWCQVKETALAAVKSQQIRPQDPIVEVAIELFKNGQRYFGEDATPVKGLFTGSSELVDALNLAAAQLAQFQQRGTINHLPTEQAWAALLAWADQQLGIEANELLISCLLELYPEICDPLGDQLNFRSPAVLPLSDVAQLRELLANRYRWTGEWPATETTSRQNFWYFSVDSEEPLIGTRGQDPGETVQRPLDIAQRAQALEADLADKQDGTSIASFLFDHPEHRFILERIAAIRTLDYAEIHTNLLAADCIPLHLQRFQLAQYGMARFDPQSIYWVRVTLYQGAPTAAQVSAGADPAWFFPEIPTWVNGSSHE